MKMLFGTAGAAAALAIGLTAPHASAQQATTPKATTPQTTAPQAAAPAAPQAGDTLIGVIKADPELSTFAKLAQGAGFDPTLSGPGPLTVLAPSNAAFAKLPPAELEALQKPENAAQLQQLLLYHIIPAAAPSSALKGTAGDVPTAKGNATVKIDGTGETLKVNGATITRADVSASNGTVHIIDTLLTPPA